MYRVAVQSGSFPLNSLIVENGHEDENIPDYRCEACHQLGGMQTRTFDMSNAGYLLMQFVMFNANGQKLFPAITDYDVDRQRILGNIPFILVNCIFIIR